MPRPTRRRSRAAIAPWELALVRAVARRFRTNDKDELEAELAQRLLALKRYPPPGIRSWKPYLAKFLLNKASNWVRDERTREKRLVVLDPSPGRGDEGGKAQSLRDVPERPQPNSDLHLILADVRKELDPELRAFWELLLRENGNQLRVARMLGKHRNTVHLWMKKIRQVLLRHGFSGKS